MKKFLALIAGSLLSLSSVADELVAYHCTSCDELSKKEVFYSYPISKNTALQKDEWHPIQSKGSIYQMTINHDHFKKGINLLPFKKKTVLEISRKDNHPFNKSAFYLHHDNNQPSLLINPQTNKDDTALLLKLTGNELSLKNHQLEKGKYQIHIYAPHDASLRLYSKKQRYFYNEPIEFELTLEPNLLGDLIKLEAVIEMPDGKQIPIEVKSIDNQLYVLKHKLLTLDNFEGSPWYLKVNADFYDEQDRITQSTSLAFEYIIPSAKISRVTTHIKENIVQAEFAIEAAMESRFALDGTLFASCNDKYQPIMQAQTASWLDKSYAELNLRFDLSKLNNKVCRGPYQIKQIHLNDYGQLKIVDTYEQIDNIN